MMTTKSGFHEVLPFFFFFLAPLLLPLISTAQSIAPCLRSCGSAAVPYPFGFSAACPIPLNCSAAGTIHLRGSGFLVQNITSDALLIDVPPSCDRLLTLAAADFFARDYAPTWSNGLLLSNCTTAISGCVIPTADLTQQFDLRDCSGGSGGGANVSRCFLNGNSDSRSFLTPENITATGCQFLLTSFGYEADSSALPALLFRTVELGWWVEGANCSCSTNASCTQVRNPVGGSPGFRCRCDEGFEGDGFSAGGGCRKESKAGNAKKILIGSVTGIAGILLACLLFCLCRSGMPNFHLKKNEAQNIESFLEKYGSSVPKRYKYSDVKRMTNSFHYKLGQGGFGSVYKGTLRDGHLVAVKVLRDCKGDGEEFVNEVASIGRTSHVNVVSLLGFCSKGSKRALIYDFMCNGSLEKFIYSEAPKATLGWEKLYQIAIGIARGLEYLHRGCNTRIVHFDIKPHNILLDQDFCPKISDFGLAKLCPQKDSVLSMAGTRGTIGYIAPEVFSRNFGVVSSKSDVYSYGMLVLEMVGGRRNVEPGASNTSEIYFPHWVYEHLDQDGCLQACGVTNETEDIARKMILVGLWCIQTMPQNRPSMGKVIDMLEGNINDLEMPPKPYLSSPLRSVVSSIS